MENGEYKISIEQRLTTLEVTVDEIKNNHLAHIQDKLDKAYLLVVTTLITVVVAFVLNYFK